MDKTDEIKAYLSFNLYNEVFAINASFVLEVLEKQRITKIPNVPQTIRGVINFRGRILPILETRLQFSMPDREEKEKYVIIVLELKSDNRTIILGAIVDSVKDVFELENTDMQEVPDLGTSYNPDFIKGMVRIDESFIMVLDVHNVFSSSTLDLANQLNQTEKSTTTA